MSGDFLMRRHNIGGVVSVMGFGSCFILMMQLLVSFLRSPLTAAFAKKLSQLALSMLPAGALVIVAPICNLLQWHPSINCLVHREESSKKTATRSLLQPNRLLRLLLVASVLSATVPVALGEVGTASFYGPPYDRTACYPGGGLIPVPGEQPVRGRGRRTMGPWGSMRPGVRGAVHQRLQTRLRRYPGQNHRLRALGWPQAVGDRR